MFRSCNWQRDLHFHVRNPKSELKAETARRKHSGGRVQGLKVSDAESRGQVFQKVGMLGKQDRSGNLLMTGM
ncbi:hypothetical protein NDU88_009635 [Pleurodeles waltl]|uniref:Uncharacterized protein n=1 Tax=Pleurodeles waltl TaxID=8319 RepID=A0AAV7QTK1_PLEWA|nr:hypothetical protein NDU88_009635 [Pleurodeles waltl]